MFMVLSEGGRRIFLEVEQLEQIPLMELVVLISKKIAHLFDFQYKKIEDPNILDDEIKEVITSPSTILCEIMGREDQSYIEVS